MEFEYVPPPFGKRVRKQVIAKMKPHAKRSFPRGVISSFAGISSPPRKKVENKPHAKQRTLPLRPPIPKRRDAPKESTAAVLLPNSA